MKFIFKILCLAFFAQSCNNNSNYSANLPGYVNYKIKDSSFYSHLSDAAISLTLQDVTYDPSYFVIPYPNGDVPSNKGVCCDVVIRAYRKMGIDLQKEVHEDMAANFDKYPRKWNLPAPDKNIDHRRVPNLMTFFERHQSQLPITNDGFDYKPGDIVCWSLPRGLTHIGIVIDSTNDEGKNNLIVHNIGQGQVIEDCLFRFNIIGHYRFKG